MVWWCSIVVRCSGAVWWCGVVVRCGGAVWWCGVVVRCGGAVWWCGVGAKKIKGKVILGSSKVKNAE